jgi:hypothetical protein
MPVGAASGARVREEHEDPDGVSVLADILDPDGRRVVWTLLDGRTSSSSTPRWPFTARRCLPP